MATPSSIRFGPQAVLAVTVAVSLALASCTGEFEATHFTEKSRVRVLTSLRPPVDSDGDKSLLDGLDIFFPKRRLTAPLPGLSANSKWW